MVKEKESPKNKKTKEEPLEEEVLEDSRKPNFIEVLNNPLTKTLLGNCKDIFKKEKADPNLCEITIKAPSEVVLKLFNVE